jgi:hypothetical protein
MSTFKIVTKGSVQKVVKEDGSEVTWLDNEYRTWLGQGNMPDIVSEEQPPEE